MDSAAAKVNFLRSENELAARRPILCFLPGGPGFSSATLRGARRLSRSFDLALIDPPGTGGTKELPGITLEGVLSAITTALEGLMRPMVLVGHSFGGIYAVELALHGNLDVLGLALIAAPVRPETFSALEGIYASNRTENLRRSERKWEENPSDATFREWMFECLFFSERNAGTGRELILADTTSFRTFLAVRTAWNPGGDHIRRLRELAMPKLIISGAEDRVLPAALSQSDAEAIGARFHVLQRTGHFPTLDEPEAVARLVENTFGGRNGDK